ncbi:MAG: hypothetical protein Fur0034_06170 [Desulfuromonadia bacterium]
MEIPSITSPYDRFNPRLSAYRGGVDDTVSPSRDGVSGKGDDRAVQQEVQKLKAQEEKVRAHEAAHKAAGGQYAGAVSYTYRPGPDGRSYIVGGEVQIDVSPGKTPEETIRKMAIVQRAALAPSDPSGQDRAVAAQAASLAAQAQQELARGEGMYGAPSSEPTQDPNRFPPLADPGPGRRREGVRGYQSTIPLSPDPPATFSIYA